MKRVSHGEPLAAANIVQTRRAEETGLVIVICGKVGDALLDHKRILVGGFYMRKQGARALRAIA